MYTTLVSVSDLRRHVGDADWRLVDCRFTLNAPEAGQAAYAQAHLPGAHYLHLDRDLSGPKTASSGRHPLPDPMKLAARLAALGIGADSQVVAYDDSAGMFAARAWWLLRGLGYPRVAVLDGGITAWRDAGGPLTDEDSPIRAAAPPGSIPARFTALSADDIEAGLARGELNLFDVRASERFTGATEPLDPVAGHIPGAVNLPYTLALDAKGSFLPPATLNALFARHAGLDTPAGAAFMCGSGVTACHTLLAMEVAGRPGARLYAGSWSEWCRDPRRPIASGPT